VTAFCPRCGSARVADMGFCAQCGLDLTSLPLATPTTPISSPVAPIPEHSARDSNSLVVIAGGALVILGSFLPWISVNSAFGTIGRSGMDGGGDGVITLVLGVGIVVIGATRFLGMVAPSGAIRFWPPLLAGIIAVALAVIEGIYVSDRLAGTTSEYVSGSTGSGIWAIGIGGVLTALAAIRSGPRRPTELVLVSGGWWHVEESDLTTLIVGKSVHLDLDVDALVLSEVIGTPIITLPFADKTIRLTPVDSTEIAIGATAGWSAVLRRSTNAMSPEELVRVWRASLAEHEAASR
jgi:hypothetical protein